MAAVEQVIHAVTMVLTFLTTQAVAAVVALIQAAQQPLVFQLLTQLQLAVVVDQVAELAEQQHFQEQA